jgi:predicted RNase H-like HicB family nuclease
MRQLTYRVLLNREPEGGYMASVPTLPGCITYGTFVDEAISMDREVIELYIESLVAHNEGREYLESNVSEEFEKLSNEIPFNPSLLTDGY